MKPLGVILLAYIAGLIIYFIMDYYKKENDSKAKEMNNNEEKTEG